METNIAQHMRSERKKEIKANATQNSETHYSQFSIIPEALQNALKMVSNGKCRGQKTTEDD